MRAAPLLALVLLATGCGQRGDLYLPSADREAVVTVPADATITPSQSPPPSPNDPDDDDAQPPAVGGGTR